MIRYRLQKYLFFQKKKDKNHYYMTKNSYKKAFI